MKQLFLTSSGDCVIDDIVKKLPKTPKEFNLAFINTAAEVEDEDHWWVRAEKGKLIDVGFSVDEFSINGMTREEIENKLEDKQIVYFCGGNEFYLLDQVIKTGCGEIIKNRIESGMIYIGSSAGSMIVGTRIDLVSTIDDRSKAPGLKSTGLKIIDLSILPHWGSDAFRNEYLKRFEAMYTEGVKITPLTDQQYVWVNNDSIQIIEV
ncbi:peptidase E [Patescibacteria group bacterium]|nr:peptidase E [Patescibacteria group bacterium]MCG2701864.1 peptidase E [Candidatus Parcubacteria bacterium]MBU4265417.1 peptidase E [Patescibacteria group bacterium]MBU4390369.1 peptidase E [Patescibacteria group bacterium]MBU4396615.1 peptidase E [Patescibacteria group bacterium]